jgi:DNA polymerase
MTLYTLDAMKQCTACSLHETRLNVVPGRGNFDSTLWLVGEAPGKDEDMQGLAFVGRGGRLLDHCLEQTNIRDFGIANILKCRPPENRDPEQGEMEVCSVRWLEPQILQHRPLVIVAMGRYSIGFFRRLEWDAIKKMGVTREVQADPYRTPGGRWVVNQFHPAYVLRNGEVIETFLQRLRIAKALHTKLLTQARRRASR